MDPYVFDTSAVLNFGQRGHLQPLLTRFGRIYQLLITPDVVGELTDPHHKPFNDAFVPAHFTIQSPKTTAFDLETLTRFAVMFGPGEISVMALAKELHATAVLDERAARAEAVKLGLKFTGTLGLLNDARQRRLGSPTTPASKRPGCFKATASASPNRVPARPSPNT